MAREPGECALCGRHMPLTLHHLIPRKLHRRPRFKKQFEREQLEQGVLLCRPCHSGIHRLYDEMTLARELNTLAALKADPRIAAHVNWVSRQKRRL